MKIVKRLLFSVAGRLPLSWLQQHSPLPVLIPYQHVVADAPVPGISALYACKGTRQFEEDLDFMLRHFRPVTLPDLIRHRQEGSPFPRKSFLLTFDDGLRSVYETVMPILLRKGVSAALFVCPAFVGNRQLFYDLKKGLILHHLQQRPAPAILLTHLSAALGIRLQSSSQLAGIVGLIDYRNQALTDVIGAVLEIDFQHFLHTVRPFMEESEIRHFISAGFHVGAHSWDHPLYRLVSPEEQLRQTFDSLNWVCNTFRLPYRAFAFPHVDTGVPASFFQSLFQHEASAPDLVLGNQTGRVESNARMLHRYIGENPAVSASGMSKTVLAYAYALQKVNKLVVQRD